MDTKSCRGCKKIKCISGFNKDKSSKDGIKSICRECQSIERKQYYQEHKDIEIARAIQWSKNNPEKAKESDIKYKKNNKQKVAQRQRDWAIRNEERLQIEAHLRYLENKEDILEYSNQYYQDNKDTKIKEYNIKNKDKISVRAAKYKKDHKEGISEYNKQYKKERTINDAAFNLRKLVSNSISTAIKRTGNRKKGSILDHLEYSIDVLVQHIETQFEWWMTWDNHGKYDPKTWNDNASSTWKWQLDHIIPHSTFHYETMNCDEFRECWSLSNLRPLAAKQNHEDGVRRKRHK